MKFGAVAPKEAIGATAVHTIRKGALVLKKGTLIGPIEAAALQAAGITDIVVARLEPSDVSEDVAAAGIAEAIAGEGVHVDRAFTGRANLFARAAGVLVVDKNAVDGINRVDEAITVATLSAYKPVVAGEMIATVKIIPFAVAASARDLALAAAQRPLIRVAPYRIRKVGIVSTLLPGLSPKVIDKTLKITTERLVPANASIVAERRVPHEQAALARALGEVLREGAELVIVFGASAIADRRDVIPAALEAIGGRIEHFGMPVDPGNLLLIGSATGHPVLGAPGCARSPKENGFDWVLMRLLAGLKVPREDITGMGVGGLLMEIVTRPQPRDEPVHPASNIAALVLAAGRSSRMGGPNKLLAEIGGRPLVRIAVEEALASQARPVIVVTGHQRERVEAALAGLPVDFVHNPKFADGLGTSLRAGIAALPAQADAVIVCLGDMPQVDATMIDRLIGALDPDKGALIAIPTIDGQRGNPVVWSRRFFSDLMNVEGDVGARHLISRYSEAVVEVPLTGSAALTDVDTPEALEAVSRPIFLEGEAGVGKTEIAKVLSATLGRRLIRLQCYEGLDVAAAVYEWNYAAQMIAIRVAEAEGAHDRARLEHDIFSERFLIKRPLLQALEPDTAGAPVLLIDEIDRTDEAFEAFLLEVLSDFQVTIPEMGTVKATHPPVVVITSNRTREVHDALKRRCLYHWVGYPSAERELAIVRAKVPGVGKKLSEQVVAFVQALRKQDLFKSPGVAETLDWASALSELDVVALDPATVSDTLGVLLKYQDDIARLEGSKVKELLDEMKSDLRAAE